MDKKGTDMTKLDDTIEAIALLSYAELRTMAQSLGDVLSDQDYDPKKNGSDELVPILYDWSIEWESQDDEG